MGHSMLATRPSRVHSGRTVRYSRLQGTQINKWKWACWCGWHHVECLCFFMLIRDHNRSWRSHTQRRLPIVRYWAVFGSFFSDGKVASTSFCGPTLSSTSCAITSYSLFTVSPWTKFKNSSLNWYRNSAKIIRIWSRCHSFSASTSTWLCRGGGTCTRTYPRPIHYPSSFPIRSTDRSVQLCPACRNWPTIELMKSNILNYRTNDAD